MLYQKACQISSTSISCQSTSLFEIVCRSWLWLLGVWPACDCTWRSWKVPSSVQASPPWSGIFGWGKNGEIYPGTRIFGRLGDFESFLTERRNHHPRTKKIRYKYHSSYLRNTNSCTLLHNIFHCFGGLVRWKLMQQKSTSFPAWILVHFGNYSHLGFALGSARLRALGCQGHGQDGLKPRHLTLPRPAGHNRISWCSAAAKLFTTGVEKGMEMMRWWDNWMIGWCLFFFILSSHPSFLSFSHHRCRLFVTDIKIHTAVFNLKNFWEIQCLIIFWMPANVMIPWCYLYPALRESVGTLKVALMAWPEGSGSSAQTLNATYAWMI